MQREMNAVSELGIAPFTEIEEERKFREKLASVWKMA
ncbi:hypothetical protein FHS16_001459 [Paenibacillus endophyticus]|uniref:Uncharacterized protein n=1 Tax=Paenibacillus endophyticus TaxID=1294268 RepID=A0A7W5C5E2_9BACL|nr:hypothetical protein [Paenibacillus endophyticus]